MRRFAPALAFALLWAAPAGADCAGEIAAMFSGGALDPFERPNRREVTLAIGEDGSETPVSDVLWDGPIKSVNCQDNACWMNVANKIWSAPGSEGPWTLSPSQLSDDPAGFVRAMTDDMAANLTDTVCAGEAALEGRQATKYIYRTRTNPNEFGSWWGALYTAFFDIETNQLVRLEEIEAVASWAPEPGPGMKVTTVTYDATISIMPPVE